MSGTLDDYYALLGIAADADEAEVRSAWRRLALRWHPDRAGADATVTFQRISAAYTVISDPVARAAYDRRRGIRTGSTPRKAGSPSAPAPSRAPEPAPAPPIRRAPAVMLQRLSGSLNSLLACGIAQRTERDVIDLLLSAQEMAEGGMISISMYVPVRCPSCRGDAMAACSRCETRRTVDELFSAWLAVRPDVAEGTLLAPSADLPGMTTPLRRARAVHPRAPTYGAR
jgi:DnaJ-class molecular chaperone